MIHKLLAGKGKMKRGLSLLLCLALLGSSVISTNVSAAEADTDVPVEAETADTDSTESADEATVAKTANETTETTTEKDATETEVESEVVKEAPAEDTTGGNEISTMSLDDSDDGISLTAGQGGGSFNPNPGGTDTTSTKKVYWDTIRSNGSSGYTAQNSETGVESVTISGGGATNDGEVAHEDGTQSSSSKWTATTASINNTGNSSESVAITITPSDGYYVTYVTICCTTSGAPLSCTTYNSDSAYTANFTISEAGVITLSVPLSSSAGFYHTGSTNPYFILIQVDKIPSPLYVEYDYGEIVNNLNEDGYSATEFTSTCSWTVVNSNNEYGDTAGSGDSSTNGVMTSDTQYKYTYDTSDSTSSSATWKHYANSISEAALAQAAADGYYFVGWLATYYTTCDVAETTDDKGNDWTYTFSSQYGTTSEYYQPGNEVPLTVHVQLVAQWVKVTPNPGKLTITKTFDGLSESEYPASITFVVYNSGGVQVGTVTLSSENEWTGTVESLNPGSYTVVETGGYDVDGYTCTTEKSISVTLGYTSNKTLNSDNTYTYTVTTTDGSVSFVNTYEKSTTSVTVKKVWSDSGDAYGLQPSSVTVNLLKDGVQYSVNGNYDDYIVELDSNNNWIYTWSNLPIYDDDDQEIIWTVSEDDVTYYKTNIAKDTTVTEGIGYVITNTLNTTDVTVIKNVTGNMGDTTKTFTFTYKVTAGDVTITNNESFDLLDYNQNSNDSEVIEGVPVGATITLTETNGDGYTTSVTYSNGNVSESDGVYTVTIAEGSSQVITVTNNYNINPDTGINLDSAPYVLMLAGVAILGGVVLFRRRKKLL